MLLGGHHRRLLGPVDVRLVDDDDKGDGKAGRDGAAGPSLCDERLHDVAAGRIPESRRHGRLQLLPSRASISSAARGPHSPGR